MVKNVYVKFTKGEGAFLKRANRYKGRWWREGSKIATFERTHFLNDP